MSLPHSPSCVGRLSSDNISRHARRESWRCVIPIALCAVGLALAGANLARASTFSVNPTQILLSDAAPSQILTLKNESAVTLRFQLSAFAWSQGPQGEMQLGPTTEVVFFPALLSLAPKEERKVRIGSTASAGSVEKTFRLFVEELPPVDKAVQGQATVRVLTKMGIPIFLRPSRFVPEARISGLALGQERLEFSLQNGGNVHFVPQWVRVRGLGPSGALLFERPLQAWYILAGGRLEFHLDLPHPECTRTTALLVEARIGDRTISDRLQTPPAACR